MRLISLISKTNISNISEISFSWKWLTPIAFPVSIIQLPFRKDARYGSNVPNCYLKTKAKYEQGKNYFSDEVNKVFQKPYHSFRILPNVSMKYCSVSIVKTLLMYRVCITKRPREILQRLTDFWIKKNDILRLFECLELSESTACYQKSRCDCIVALCILLKRLSNPCRCKDMVPLFERKQTGLRLMFTLDFLK